ncbi:unnamed protein product, partial [Nesidiocoris tenuis]
MDSFCVNRLIGYIFCCIQGNHLTRLIHALEQLNSNPSVTPEQVKSAVLPLLKGHGPLADHFLHLLPNEKPPPSITWKANSARSRGAQQKRESGKESSLTSATCGPTASTLTSSNLKPGDTRYNYLSRGGTRKLDHASFWPVLDLMRVHDYAGRAAITHYSRASSALLTSLNSVILSCWIGHHCDLATTGWHWRSPSKNSLVYPTKRIFACDDVGLQSDRQLLPGAQVGRLQTQPPRRFSYGENRRRLLFRSVQVVRSFRQVTSSVRRFGLNGSTVARTLLLYALLRDAITASLRSLNRRVIDDLKKLENPARKFHPSRESYPESPEIRI